MTTINDFSFLIVTRLNSRERLEGVYQSIRRFYDNEIVIVYDDVKGPSLNSDDVNLNEIYTNERVYVSGGYNIALKNCTNKCFVFLHDDTFVAKNFLENIAPNVTENQFCNFTTIEPPLGSDPDTIEKPIKDFGRNIKTFNINMFDAYCQAHIKNINTPVIKSLYGGFFMAGYKKSIDSVNGFDEYFKPYFYEDSDLMTRLHIAGFRFVQVLNSLVYHMGSLTSRGTDESVIAHNTTHELFLKKWKVPFEAIKKYTMEGGFEYKDIPVEIDYTNCNQAISKFIESINTKGSNIKITIDGSRINNEDLNYLQSLPYVLQSIDEPGLYEISNLKINYTINE